ncbi:hypothetical protein N781_15590 [Pontibacillus halophilus JSM 076056 = DSM 19796]|uniref:YutG/PgpA domain-containing protein n=1 Tax=Pontibacillus halophilus JSM 076056 = DSM 19796 TaxID=1385510 RepID=A0A0A5GHI6_9BACI|nr:phosphatidylglycerophosphatase A [Pontibacillus halophilus]KGX92731.1 hypothetical protein N781_15590 [Pontibacillus halophilus JSM 076056 = DSM 19796]
MTQQPRQVHSKEVADAAKQQLVERGVTIESIADIVYNMQHPYNPSLTLETCTESVNRVLEKREVQHALLVAIELDRLAEQNQLSEPLQSIVAADEGLFGVDETIALGATYGFGSIAVSTFGYLDRAKPGIIGELDTKQKGKVHTFLDDLVATVASNASGRVAHRLRDVEEQVSQFS